MARYDFPDHTKGDSFDGVSFTIKVNDVALNLAGATILMDLKLNPTDTVAVKRFTSETLGGITIDTVPATGKFVFDAQVISVDAGEYYYDIEIELSNHVVKTYISGRWTILQDITS